MRTIPIIQQECWNYALHCLGTSYVFSKKADTAKQRIRLITALGIIVPLGIGGIVITYGLRSQISVWALVVVGPIGLFQLVLSGVSLVYKWDDLFAYSLESQTDNRGLSDEYQKLARNPPATATQMDSDLNIIRTKDQARTTQDEKYTFSTKENAEGMRYALWIMKRPCATCNIVPASMKPTKCETCGNF